MTHRDPSAMVSGYSQFAFGRWRRMLVDKALPRGLRKNTSLVKASLTTTSTEGAVAMQPHVRNTVITVGALAVLSAGAALTALPSTAHAAQWLAPAAAEKIKARWVKEVDYELRSDQFKNIFINAPGGAPQAAILRYLNHAADALDAGNKEAAKDFVDQALGVVDNGIRKGWYSKSDVAPLRNMIVAKADKAMMGQETTGHISPDRWTGYTHDRRLGLTERFDNPDATQRYEDEAQYEEGGTRYEGDRRERERHPRSMF